MDQENNQVEHIITFLLRMFLGVLFFFAGLSKIKGGVPDAVKDRFAETFLPMPMVEVFFRALGPVELLIGVLLLAGLITRPALLLTAVLLIVLFFGLVISHQHDKAPALGIYLLLTLLALRNSVCNRFSIDAMIRQDRS